MGPSYGRLTMVALATTLLLIARPTTAPAAPPRAQTTPSGCEIARSYIAGQGPSLASVQLDGCELIYLDLTGADLSQTNLVDTRFPGANPNGANLDRATME
ncbi:MAG: hypothetical protein AVDCRST_MAG33-639 [uncultured Thermomicrobiales bacterium]|uniref:Pentapeptide repeat family protein n=1 Tax=uncultured Thermomicrobiales bacterium TaxID=1645740 RepID=A0A6J4UF06_9BACT|nr:MAG: hypothetical protein AVDCRST_MAG33-639 [uncultured Thermomicrobiales bacterium]